MTIVDLVRNRRLAVAKRATRQAATAGRVDVTFTDSGEPGAGRHSNLAPPDQTHHPKSPGPPQPTPTTGCPRPRSHPTPPHSEPRPQLEPAHNRTSTAPRLASPRPGATPTRPHPSPDRTQASTATRTPTRTSAATRTR